MDWFSWYKKLQRDDAQGGWQGRPATQREELPNPSKIQEGIAPALPYTVPGFDDGEDKRLFGCLRFCPGIGSSHHGAERAENPWTQGWQEREGAIGC